MQKKLDQIDIFPLICGIGTALLGVMVLFGWYARNEALIQVLPHFAPMQYNTALGFLLAGLGLISLTFRRPFLAGSFGISCVLLGSATLIQYVLGMNFGLDEMFMDAYVHVKTTNPGRMAPSTALGFTLVGLSLISGIRHQKFLIGIATSVFALSMLAFAGYLTNVESVYGWGNLTRMAIHTATCFLTVSLGIIYLGVTQQGNSKRDFWNFAPLALSSVVLVFSLLSWYGIKEATQVRNTEYFDRLVSDTNEGLLKRYNLYQHSLLGGAGLYSASEYVERHEWRAYVNALDIEANLPGIAGLGFIDSVQIDDLPDYIETTRLDGAPSFINHPETPHVDKFIIKFIEPEEFNSKAIGLDIGFEENRRSAAEHSRDNGIPALTKKIVLVQDGQRTSGFLLLVPVYDTLSLPETIELRKEYFRGWVYAPFIASNFLKELMSLNKDQVGFKVYDGDDPTPEALIYSSTSAPAGKTAYHSQSTLNLAERHWTIEWSSTEKFEPVADQTLSMIVLIFGILCSIILYGALLRLLRSKQTIARKVEKQTRKLAESERRLQLVFDNAGEGILGLNTQGLITFANRAAQNLLGLTLKDMLNRSQHDLIQSTHLDGTVYEEKDSHVFSATKNGISHTEDSEVFWHKDGSAIPVEHTSRPIKDETGEITGAVVIFRDIAERKAAEEDIRQANAELEEFAYRTSHDLRSPLVSSMSLLGIAEKAIHSNDKDKALASLDHTQKSLKKLADLVKDILVLTQVKNEQEDDQAIDLENLTQEALDKFRYMDHFDRLDIQCELDFSDVLYAKKSRIILIIDNLISNAVKYQDLSKDTSFLKISTFKDNNNFVMEVQDNGLGVPQDQQKNLFKMFKRFHPRTSFGSGLGLYMMKKSINILGGQIEFEDPGEGSIFRFSIPLP